MDSLPGRLVLLGVEPGDLSTGLGLSPAVEQGLALVVNRVAAELAEWGLEPLALAADALRAPGFWASKDLYPQGEKEATP